MIEILPKHHYLLKNVRYFENLDQEYFMQVHNGKIEFMGNQKPFKKTWDFEIDGLGAILLPGMIDSHTHMRDPGFTHKEDLFTASLAAAHGGVTTFLDMPNTQPATMTLKILEEKKKIAASKAFVHYGFYFGASALDNSEVIKKIEAHRPIKLYLNETTGNLFVHDWNIIENIVQAAKGIIALHAEGVDLIDRIVGLAKKYQKSLYFCHISQKNEMQRLLNWKEKLKKEKANFSLFIEVTPHHLFYCQDDLHDDNCYRLLMKPTLKSSQDRDFLFSCLKQGLIDTIGTDHAPHLLEEKKKKPTYGVPSIEVALVFLLDLVNQGILSFKELVKLYSSRPASIFGLKFKGSLKIGWDADFLLISLTEKTILNSSNIVSKCGWSLFENTVFQGKVLSTWVDGVCVYDGIHYHVNNQKKEVFI